MSLSYFLCHFSSETEVKSQAKGVQKSEQEKEVPKKTLFLCNATCFAHALLPKTVVISRPQLTRTTLREEHGHKCTFRFVATLHKYFIKLLTFRIKNEEICSFFFKNFQFASIFHLSPILL